MTTKEKAISLIQSLGDDISLDDVIDRLYLLRKIELGIAQADAGDSPARQLSAYLPSIGKAT